MKAYITSLLLALLLFPSGSKKELRTIEDFNFNWQFSKGDHPKAKQPSFNDASWETVRLPHDWSILAGYQQENTAASTGFTEGGIGWYRKTFRMPKSDKNRIIRIEFDGVYCKSEVWINGNKLGYRPNGYSSFSYELTDHINFGEDNVIAVKVDHTAYVDSRWYTGSGIYRDVRLVKTAKVYIPHWGIKINTPSVETGKATAHIETKIEGAVDRVALDIDILNPSGEVIASQTAQLPPGQSSLSQTIDIPKPDLWGIENPVLYTARMSVKHKGKLVDEVEQRFGIRKFRFDPDKGFFLNGKHVKIKGVNLHHDAGAVGAATTKGNWEYRINKLKSIGVNAVRMAHNPHSPLLMDVCDEMGMLVMNEFFDEWHRPKGKSVVYLGDNAAGKDISKGYSEVFLEWAEKDLKDLIRRDFNHPSVIMWSIGNEIEWTFPAYSKAFKEVEGEVKEYTAAPNYDTRVIKPIFDSITGGVDSLSIVAHQLSTWVKEEDKSRPIVCGSVRPTIAFASGYADAVDVLGLNYRAIDYDVAHEAFPDKCLMGSENWVAYSEWKACQERDFISGIFVWTGFAYLGEAGPWPRKGLNISLFDFAGFQNPRGHFFECLWTEKPKVYAVTTPASESEFSYSEKEGWKFDIQWTAPPVWNRLRLWEWYKVNEHWNYKTGEDIVVQTYTNCEEAELFLNGESMGKQALADFSEDDNIIKWLVPYQKGELKVVGYQNGNIMDTYILASTGKAAKIELISNKTKLKADRYDLAHLSLKVFDEAGIEMKDLDAEVKFKLDGNADLLAVDNGWEMNVASHYSNEVRTHNGRALAIVRSSDKKGSVKISASIGGIISNAITIDIK